MRNRPEPEPEPAKAQMLQQFPMATADDADTYYAGAHGVDASGRFAKFGIVLD